MGWNLITKCGKTGEKVVINISECWCFELHGGSMLPQRPSSVSLRVDILSFRCLQWPFYFRGRNTTWLGSEAPFGNGVVTSLKVQSRGWFKGNYTYWDRMEQNHNMGKLVKSFIFNITECCILSSRWARWCLGNLLSASRFGILTSRRCCSGHFISG